MSVAVPEGVDWEIERVLTSGKYPDSRREIVEEWSYEHLVDAHLVLDMYEELEQKAAKKASPKP